METGTFSELKLFQYLKKIFGEPDHIINNPTASKIAKYKGIVVFEVNQLTQVDTQLYGMELIVVIDVILLKLKRYTYGY